MSEDTAPTTVTSVADFVRHQVTALDPNSAIIFGPQIDRDLSITTRARNLWIAKGILPEPDGRMGDRPFWLVGTYAKFKADLLGGKFARRPRVIGRSRLPGAAKGAAEQAGA